MWQSIFCENLAHSFSPSDEQEDPTLLLDLKTDVQEECEKFGPVISVALYDVSFFCIKRLERKKSLTPHPKLEPEGIMTVKFRELESARACVQRMNGRFFAKRQMLAYQMEKKEKFRQSSSRLAGADEEAEEEARLRAYEDWLDQQE